ncbi:rCG34459 [Rattus norvegicus]|uniref:RCG34459 n=1 Tax=Rattus norvegicus TaxID=10116 RepID=A6HDP8_RAT|nr:rCG34459 [Rattus norvegicus]
MSTLSPVSHGLEGQGCIEEKGAWKEPSLSRGGPVTCALVRFFCRVAL